MVIRLRSLTQKNDTKKGKQGCKGQHCIDEQQYILDQRKKTEKSFEPKIRIKNETEQRGEEVKAQSYIKKQSVIDKYRQHK